VAQVSSVSALVGLNVLELAALVPDGIELGAGSASHCGAATRHHGSCRLGCGASAQDCAEHLQFESTQIVRHVC
jgi:hypothetical protein